MPLNFFKKKSKKMPFFQSQSDEAKRRLQHQLYLAQENPEPEFDLSECQIAQIPSSVFSLCRILYKEVLLLHDNWLTSIDATGKLSDLQSLKVLDLHKNEIKHLPKSINHLQNLRILNVSENELRSLPEEIGELVYLRTLDVKHNRIRQLPKSLSRLTRLRKLDISENEITILPIQLCQLKNLQTLILDSQQMIHPSKEICEKGTVEIMKALCLESGTEYEQPANKDIDNLDEPRKVSNSWSNNSFKVRNDEVKLMESVEQYQSQMDKKHKERLLLEKQLLEDQNALTNLATKVYSHKKHLIDSLAQDQEKFDRDLSTISSRKDSEHRKLLCEIVQVETTTDNLISKLIDINARAKKTEALLEAVEKERRENDDWFVVRWEEIQNLRKQEVIHAMESMIRDSGQVEISRQTFTSDREHTARKILHADKYLSERQVEDILDNKEHGQKILRDTLAQQEELQRQAFEVLQLQKDKRHQRLTSQIILIEEQLAELTTLELERHDLRAETEMNILCEKRLALCAMLSQLMEERERRQKELHMRLVEMEEQRQDGQVDYWMVQYQRLMDSKPNRLIDQERNLEISVLKILQQSGAEDYVPLFARNRITIETMLQLSEDDMKQMGIPELGLRRSIMNHIDEYKASTKTKQLELADQGASSSKMEDHQVPSAPGESEMPRSPTEDLNKIHRQESITAHGLHSECSICLDKKSQVLFLRCGHVCCCAECSKPLKECPLCRGEIVQRIRLDLTG